MTIPSHGAVTEHGTWARYTPDPVPADAPPNALFSRRDSDGLDWYDYVNSGNDFTVGTVQMTVGPDNIVRAAVTDPTRLFPGTGVRVLEIAGASLTDPQTDWGGKIYDPATQTFSDPPPIDWGPMMSGRLEARIAALEAKLGDK